MALTATVYNFNVSLSNVDRGVYESFKLQLACHPSETLQFLLTRLFAYCLELREGISFTKGLAESEEPAIWAHDHTGKLTLWLEVGLPRAERIHKASKRGAEVVVYVHKDPSVLLTQLTGHIIHNSEHIRVHGFSPGFLDSLLPHIEKRTTISLSLSESHLYVGIGPLSFTTEVTTATL